MNKKKKAKRAQNNANKITTADYIKAVKKADREIELTKSAGWVAKNKIHKSKKIYTRRDNKLNDIDI